MNPSLYDIHRTAYENEIGLLLGNGEMGGLARNDGLGFDEIWFTDYWRDPACRASLAGFGLSNPDVNAEQLSQSDHRQSLSLRDGILQTRSGLGFDCEMFFSTDNPHLLIMRLANTGSKDSD
jgi:hypothetical protein